EGAGRLGREEAARTFDLSRGPLLRVRLMQMGEREHIAVMNVHHIVCDGWSLGIMVREVGELYGGHVKGEAAGLEELPVQYGDYAVWQREWAKGEILEEQIGSWGEKLGGGGMLELPGGGGGEAGGG